MAIDLKKINSLTDEEIHHIFITEIDGIAQSASEFIADDGPLESEAHVADLAAANHIRQVYTETYSPIASSETGAAEDNNTNTV